MTELTENQARVYSAEDKRRLTELVDEGVTILQEIEDLKGGLSDTVKSISEEVDVKPAMLNKAIRVAFKRNLHKERESYEELEDLLETIQRG